MKFLHATTCLLATAALAAQDRQDADAAVRRALRSLQGVDLRTMPPAEQDEANRKLNEAWKVLRADKARAVPALKAEVQRYDREKLVDDFFRLEAACLLYDLAKMNEIDAIAVAVRDIDPTVSVNLTSRLASNCARTQDPRVLPVLGAMLRTDRESPPMYFVAHAFPVPWPMSLDFTWGPYGAGASEYLMARLRGGDAKVRRSALYLLTTCRHMPVLEVCRKWAADKNHELRNDALRTIGTFADPRDKDLLVAATRDSDAGIRFAAAYALYEYGDPATAPALRALLGDDDQQVRLEAVFAAAHVIDVATGQALAKRLTASTDARERASIQQVFQLFVADFGADAAKLAAGDQQQWQQAIAAYWAKRDAHFARNEGDRELSRKAFERALETWSEKHSMTAVEELRWIGRRELLSVATPADLPELLRLRSRLLWRQSDEVVHELRDLDRVIAVLHRRKVGAPKPNE